LAFAEISAISVRHAVECDVQSPHGQHAQSLKKMAIVLHETLVIKALAGHDE
jgi:hypothetical protein